MKDEFYKVIDNRTDYKGVRYFRFNLTSEKVVQVTMNHGEAKKGRTNCFGVSLIHRLTFLSNYMAPGYLVKCTKKEYQKNFTKVVKMLNY